jgi:preprotein translocase subunit SecF
MALTFIKTEPTIDFIGRRKIFYILSIIVVLIGLASLVVKGGPTYGIDFAGGAIIQIKFDSQVSDEEVKRAIANADLPAMVIQQIGADSDNEFLIRLSETEGAEYFRDILNQAMIDNLPQVNVEIQRTEMVGPKVGADLRSQAIEALFYASLLISIYISGRFEHRWFVAAIMAVTLGGGLYVLGQIGVPSGWLVLAATIIACAVCWRLKLLYALSAMVGLIHDIAITIGVLSLLNIEVDLIIIAAILTIIGYSLNDTIVIFDRIRENLRGKKYPTFAETINRSINQTLSRTIITSGSTLFVVLALFFLGGSILRDFALTLIVGIIVGSYSSIFVSSPILLIFGEPKEPDNKEAAVIVRDEQGAVV